MAGRRGRRFTGILLGVLVWLLISTARPVSPLPPFLAGDSRAASVEEVSRLLMDPCPNCRGKQLSSCDCGEAEEMKREIRGLLEEGKTEDEIVEIFVDRYGPWIRSAPEKAGFNLVGYILPFGLLVIGGGGLVLFLRRSVRKDLSAGRPRRYAPDSDRRAGGRGGPLFDRRGDDGGDDAPAGQGRSTSTLGADAGTASPTPQERARLEDELRRLDG